MGYARSTAQHADPIDARVRVRLDNLSRIPMRRTLKAPRHERT